MPLRQVDIYLPDGGEALSDMEDERDLIDRRDIPLDDGGRLIRVLLKTSKTEGLLDWLQGRLEDSEGHRIIVTGIGATLPRQTEEDEEDEEGQILDGDRRFDEDEQREEGEDEEEVSRISREEVYQEVNNSISVTKVHYTLVILSTIVAAGGMLRDSPAVVIGAMVIAPLIGPNIALALGTTLADWNLLKRAAKVNLIGLVIALVLSVVAGIILPVDATVNEIASRAEVNMGDVALALAAGIAGVLSVTRGVATALIGVMVAVALLPPLVAVGLLAGMGLWAGAYGAAMLTLTNVVAINLAGVVTFLVQGIRPTTWYEEEKAKKARFVAIGLWLLVLGLLITAIVMAPPVPV